MSYEVGSVLNAAWSSRAPKHRRRCRTPQQRAGIAFERNVAKALRPVLRRRLRHGPWIKFSDEAGTHYAQPDLVVEAKPLLLIEVKLTYTNRAWAQLEKTYIPLLRRLYDSCTICPVVLCKHLGSEPLRSDPVALADLTSLDDFASGMILTWNTKDRLGLE